MNENLIRVARENAGLSVGQAARLLSVERAVIEEFEAADPDDILDEFPAVADRMADLYGVCMEWMLGQVPRYDDDAVRDIDGYDRLSVHDRKTLAELLASRRRGMGASSS